MDLDILKTIGRRMPHHIKVCMVTGLVAGWITHFYMLTHKLPNWDDVTNLHQYGSGDYLGRWFLKYIHRLGTRYSIPALHGTLMLLFLTLSACLVLEILRLRSTTASILVPMLMVTFPSVACTMTFMFMAHTSGIAIFMFCLAVYLLRRYRWGALPCTLLIICGLGVYQSYVSIAITLMLLGMISDMLSDKELWPTVKQGLVCIAVLVAAVLIYMWLCHVIDPDIDSETYGGIGNMGQIALGEMPRLIARCYKRFLEFFIWKPFTFMSRVKQAMNICTCILAAGLGGYLILAKKLYHKIWDCLLFVLIACFVPLAAAFVYFMAPEAPFSMLMLYAYVLIYVAVVMLWEHAARLWEHGGRSGLMAVMVSGLVTGVMMVSCYTDHLVTNKAYMRMEISFERVCAYFDRIIGRVEAMEGYQNGDAVAILGEFYYKDDPSPVEKVDVLDGEQLREMSGVALENGLLTSGVRNDLIRTYLGFDMAHLSDQEIEGIMGSDAYKAMPVYPDHDAVRQIDGVWVVKLCGDKE